LPTAAAISTDSSSPRVDGASDESAKELPDGSDRATLNEVRAESESLSPELAANSQSELTKGLDELNRVQVQETPARTVQTAPAGQANEATAVKDEVKRVAIGALIIDDSPVARRIIRRHLEEIGCTVAAEAENAASGLKLFREHRPQIVTLDLIMPLVDGVDAVQAFHTMRSENPSAKIVVVSPVPFEKTRRTMIDEGAVAYVIKPFNKFSFEQARSRLLSDFPQLEMRGE
jgi:two-component system, chemotaxis family, chemotaxis protein CheY